MSDYFNKNIPSDKEIFQDCAILIIIPFFVQAALWFTSLLISVFPDKTSNAFFTLAMVILAIEFVSLLALSVNINKRILSKRKILLFNGSFFLFGILFIWFASIAVDIEISIMTIAMGAGFLGFGGLGIYRLIKDRDTKEYVEVN